MLEKTLNLDMQNTVNAFGDLAVVLSVVEWGIGIVSLVIGIMALRLLFSRSG